MGWGNNWIVVTLTAVSGVCPSMTSTPTRNTSSTDARTRGGRTHTHHYDPAEGVPASVHVVEAVSNFVAREPVDLPVLNDAVDPDALDSLLTPTTVRGVEVTFDYAGITVTVDNRGRITLED